MRNNYRPLARLSVLLAAVLLASCKTSPVVVSGKCAQLPPIPPELLHPPESLNAPERLDLLLQELGLLLNGTHSDTPHASIF